MTERPLDLGWMRMLEAVGRLGSLSAAAQLLGLSQPAVSYQIRKLEQTLGTPLLVRLHRGAALTPAGARLHAATAAALQQLDAAASDIRASAGRPVIRLHTDYAFSALWLIPRMRDFRARNPDAELQVVATQRCDPADLPPGDVAVLFGTAQDFGPRAICLLEECVVPVATPDFPADLRRAPLIHLETAGPAPWLDWHGYLAALGLPRDRMGAQADLQLNTYSLVLQSARRGEGIALGWRGLIEDDLTEGALIPVGPEVAQPGRGYWMVPPRDETPHAARLLDWMRAAT